MGGLFAKTHRISLRTTVVLLVFRLTSAGCTSVGTDSTSVERPPFGRPRVHRGSVLPGHGGRSYGSLVDSTQTLG